MTLYLRFCIKREIFHLILILNLFERIMDGLEMKLDAFDEPLLFPISVKLQVVPSNVLPPESKCPIRRGWLFVYLNQNAL